MPAFKDENGKEWSVSINVLSLRVVREDTKFELGKIFDDDMRRFVELGSDPELFVSVLFSLVKDQAATSGTTLDQFARAMAGDALEQAFEAFREALVNFSPSQRRKVLQALAAKQREVSELETERAVAKVNASGR